MTRVMLDDGFCDSAFGSAQNDRMRGLLLKMKVFRLENPPKGSLVLQDSFTDALSTGVVCAVCNVFNLWIQVQSTTNE